MKSSLVVFCFVSIANFVFGQQIKISGTVKDSAGLSIPSALIQLKSIDAQVLSFVSSNEDGSYELEADTKDQQMIYLIAAYIGMKKDTLKIDLTGSRSNLLKHDFNLKQDAIQLEMIHIKAETPAVTSSNDTTRYNVARLTSVDDRNIESVIKKMPGMKVSNDGTIYFNLQRITKVLLEGDDMTGENYKSITKNLKPQLVEEVQAIENYVEDDLLNGIISSNEVVLNLKIKDRKSLSGSADLAYGSDHRNDISTNLLSFYKGIKAFSFFNNNNIGKYQADLLNLSDNQVPQESGKLIHNAIEDTNPFDNNYYRLNKSLAGSISAINRVNKNLKLTLGVYAIRNKLYDDRQLYQKYYLQDTIITEDNQSRMSNGKNYQVEMSADQRIGSNSRLFTSFAYTLRPDSYRSTDVSIYNNIKTDDVLQRQDDKLNNLRGELRYVLKSSTSTALIATARVSSEKTDQDYEVRSDLYTSVPDFSGASQVLQQVNTRLNRAGIDVQGLKKTGYHYFYLNSGANIANSSILTGLNLIDDQIQDLPVGRYINDNDVIDKGLYVAGKYTFDNKRIRFQIALSGNMKHVNVYEQGSTFFYLEPSVSLRAKVAEGQELSASYEMTNTTPGNLSYHKNFVLTNVRSLNSELDQLYYFNTHHISIAYQNNAFSNQYINFRISGNASFSPIGFINTNFFENMLYYSERSIYNGIRNFNGNMVFQKFIAALSTDVTVDFSLTKSHYYASTGQDIHPYSNTNQSLLLKLGTGFKLPVNFTGMFSYINQQVVQDLSILSRNEAYKYSIASRIKVSKPLVQVVSYDHYRISANDYRIMNAELLYHPENSRISYALSGKNLLNVNSLFNKSVSNVGESKSSASLLGRYVMLTVTFQ